MLVKAYNTMKCQVIWYLLTLPLLLFIGRKTFWKWINFGCRMLSNIGIYKFLIIHWRVTKKVTIMRKRSFPWSEGNGPQLKYHVSEKEVTNRYAIWFIRIYGAEGQICNKTYSILPKLNILNLFCSCTGHPRLWLPCTIKH